MINFEEIMKSAEKSLNESLSQFEQAPNDEAKSFVGFQLQVYIFQYDISAEMINILRNSPKGFASSVALKGLVLRLFEYDLLLDKDLIPKLLVFAKCRDVPINSAEIKMLRKKWKFEFTELKAWSDVRNKAAGHYNSDIEIQVALLKTLTRDSVMTVVRGVIGFNSDLLMLLLDSHLSVSNND